MPASVHCDRLSKSFGTTPVVRAVSLTVQPGESLALVGPSGCGKTTLLRLIAGFESPDGGTIRVGEQLVASADFELPPEKRRVGMVFQDYALFPHLSVLDNVRFGLGRDKSAGAHAAAMLELVGLGSVEKKMPHELSGGQQQRVALARALAPNPGVLLLDEPFSNLDAALRRQVRQEVRSLLRQAAITAIFVTHDQEEGIWMGDRIGVMREGRLEQVGPPEELFERPRTPFVARFLGQSDLLPGRMGPDGVETLLGVVNRPKTPLPPGTPLSLVLRPDDITLHRDGQPNATLLDRQFTGVEQLYSLRLDDGTLVRCSQPRRHRLPEQSRVRVALTNPQLPCLHNDALV
jgi:iron(III) transport system ATP-binding protein